MHARIRKAEFEMEFEGPAALWNDLLRPVFGGPEAEDEEPARGDHGEEPSDARPPADLDAVFARLAEGGGRRAEKDAVLVAVHHVGGARRDVSFDDVARIVHAFDAFADVRVKPHLLKHVSRSRMLEAGEHRETVRLTPKGRRHVQSLLSE